MTEKSPAEGSEREFLHGLANSLAISYGNIKLLLSKLDKDPSALSLETIKEKLVKAAGHFEKANSLLEERRRFLKQSSE